MKKYLKIFLVFSLLGSLVSCDEDTMDEINENVNDPTDVGSHLIITDVMTSTAFRIVGSDPAFYASAYIEHNVGIYNQLYNAEIRSGEPISSTTYNNSWGSVYENLYNLSIIINKCSEGGDEEGNFHTLGIAQILTAYNLAILTDLWGDVPYSEALKPGEIFTPKLDSQEDLYTEIFSLLDSARANLKKETDFSGLGDQDFYYNGNIASWDKFADGLDARYTMRLSLHDENYEEVIDLVDQSFSGMGEQCQFDYEGSSPFYMFLEDRNYFGASQSLHDKLDERNDPRDSLFFTGTDFAPNGNPDQVQDLYSKSAISTPTAPTYLLSYHELQFLKAEAFVRLNQLDSAKAALKDAIVAALQKPNLVTVLAEGEAPVGISVAQAEAYFDDEVEARFDSNPLSEVMIQKYIAMYEEEAVEAYNDYRRLKAMGDDVIDLQNPANPEQFPLRFSYGADDVTTNANVREAYGDGSYVYSENVWWAGGSR